jgi:hypothetical protein
MQKLFAAAIISIYLFSCNTGTPDKTTVQMTNPQVSGGQLFIPPPINPAAGKNNAVVTAAPSATTTSVKPVVPPTTPVQTRANPTVVLNNTTAKTAKGMNPPHGMPKHRCDIPVGAPLSSPVVKQQQAVPTVTTQTTPIVTEPGMNPPHGQPGHDCSVEVGKPLKKAQ